MAADDAAQLSQYVTRLVGRTVVPGEHVALTSGQMARVIAWAASTGIQLDPNNDDRHRFRLSAGGGGGDAGAGTAAVPQRGVPEADVAGLSGVGVDLQLVEELIAPFSDPKSVPELRELFTLREISYAECKPNPRETLCGLFAAKEAIRKADSRYLRMPLQSLEILPDPEGRPTFPGVALSISHSGGYALAAAIASRHVAAATSELRAADTIAVPEHSSSGRAARLRWATAFGYKLILLGGALAVIALAVDRFSGFLELGAAGPTIRSLAHVDHSSGHTEDYCARRDIRHD